MNRIRRVVFDTSTLVSAALRIGSVPHQALLKAFSACDICASAESLAELEEVLCRSKFNRYLHLEIRLAFVTVVSRQVHLFIVHDADVSAVEPPCRDPKNNQFLALALAADADAIVSSDADLLVLHPWNRIAILSPAEFLASTATSTQTISGA